MLGVDRRHEIAPIVHRHLRLGRDHRFDVRVIGIVIFTFDRIGWNAVIAQRRRDVVLGRERVAGAQRQLRAAGLQRQHQVRRFGGNVKARAYADAAERLLDLEAIANLCQHGHVRAGPRDARAAGFGQAAILDVAGWFDPKRAR